MTGTTRMRIILHRTDVRSAGGKELSHSVSQALLVNTDHVDEIILQESQ